MPEAIYCEGKTTEQCVQAVSEMLYNENFTDAVIATRANPEQYSAVLELDPQIALCKFVAINLLRSCV